MLIGLVAAVPISFNLTLYGTYNQFFMYYTKIQVGTPALPYTVIVDTGSSDLLIPGWGCQDCPGDPNSFYAASNSSTSAILPCGSKFKCSGCSPGNNQCQFQVGFVGISEGALLGSDLIQIQNTPIPAPFGAIINISMGQKRSAQMAKRAVEQGFYPSGIWGLAYQPLVSSGAESVLDQIIGKNGVSDVFSMCYHESGTGGTLSFGSIVPYYSGSIQYTPLTQERFYGVEVLDLQVNDESLNIKPPVYNTKNCIVDSGTPVVTLPVEVYQHLQKLIQSNCSKSQLPGFCDTAPGKSLFEGVCFNISDLSPFPNLSFTLRGGLKLNYPPEAYLRPLWSCEHGGFGLAIESDSSGFGTVLGLSLLQPYVTVHDRANKRIGFGVSKNCPNE